MKSRTVHFPLRELDPDVPMKRFLEPESQRPEWRYTSKNYVYRFYDAALQPLYIGITSGNPTRWEAHRKSSDWWSLAKYVAVSFYPTYSEIEVAEKAAIRSERPRYNRAFVTGPAYARLHLHGSAYDAAEQLFRDAPSEFLSELAQLLNTPSLFPQPVPPPPVALNPEVTQ